MFTCLIYFPLTKTASEIKSTAFLCYRHTICLVSFVCYMHKFIIYFFCGLKELFTLLSLVAFVLIRAFCWRSRFYLILLFSPWFLFEWFDLPKCGLKDFITFSLVRFVVIWAFCWRCRFYLILLFCTLFLFEMFDLSICKN